MQSLRPTREQVTRILDQLAEIPFPSVDAAAPRNLLARCPITAETPLRVAPSLAQLLDVADVSIKDERDRMGMGSFKALGAAYVIACDAEAGSARGSTYVTASAGNHGLSVAAGAKAFGAKSIVFLSAHVPEAFAERLRVYGAEVRRAGDTYEASMEAAAEAAEDEGCILLSDSSWPGYLTRPKRLMEGYLVLMSEAVDQLPEMPTHIFLQAGVGGLATSCAAYARSVWGEVPNIIVVEPEEAPALYASMEAGKPVVSRGGISNMGRLDCKEPSLIALKGLARDANAFVTLSEEAGLAGAQLAAAHGFETTPSGAAGIAGAVEVSKDTSLSGYDDIGLTPSSRVLVILSEGAV